MNYWYVLLALAIAVFGYGAYLKRKLGHDKK